eukprot:912195_1
MLSLITLTYLISTISGEASETCNHFLGSPVDHCDHITKAGRYYGLFCIDAETLQSRTFSDIDCAEDMHIGPKHDCIEPFCNCNGTSTRDACPTTSITGNPCPDYVDEEGHDVEKWTHIRDVCVTGPHLNTSVKSTCVDGDIMYLKYDHPSCGGEGSELTCIGDETCDGCEDWVQFDTTTDCPPSSKSKSASGDRDCCGFHFKSEVECNGNVHHTNVTKSCPYCGWNGDKKKCVFRSRLSQSQE